MKKIVLIICTIILMTMLIACGNKNSQNENQEIEYTKSVVKENDDGEKVMEIINYVKNDKHFDFIRNVKVYEDENYNVILNMEEGEYFSAIDKAGSITYPLGKIYLFHVRDVNEIGSIMMKAINLKGSTIDDENREYKARYLVATCGNYLIVGIGEEQEHNEIKDILSIFEKYFGKDNFENEYNLLLEVEKR